MSNDDFTDQIGELWLRSVRQRENLIPDGIRTHDVPDTGLTLYQPSYGDSRSPWPITTIAGRSLSD